MKGFLLTLLLCSNVGCALFNLDDWDLRDIEFFDAQDEYPDGALTGERSVTKSEDELLGALETLMSFTGREEISNELRLVVNDLCLHIMYIK